MPSLPTAEKLGIVPVRPSGDVATYRGATGLESVPSRVLGNVASQADALTGELIKVQDEFDATQAEDRYNQYLLKLEEIKSDPQNGWGSRKGEEAFKPGFADQYNARFDQERQRIMETMQSPGAKRRFARMAQAATLKTRADMYAHGSREHIAWAGKVYKDSMTLLEQDAWRSFGNDEAFKGTLARAESLTEAHARKWFVGADEKSIKLAVQTMKSQLWRKRIEGALDSDKTDIAQELYKKATGVLTTDDEAAISRRLKEGVRISKAVSSVDEVLAKFGPKGLNDPWDAYTIDAKLREMHANNPMALQASRAEAAHRATAHRQAQSEFNQKNSSAVLSMFYERGMSLPAIQRTPEFLAMDGDQRSRFITSAVSYMHVQEGRRLTAENRAINADIRAARERDRQGHQAYLAWRLNPTEAAKVTDAQITDFAITHGLEAANKLKDLRDELIKPGNLRQARMDQLQFKTIISQYGYDANLLSSSSLRLNPDQKKKQEELRIIYDNVNDRLQAAGGRLTDEQKERIMREAMEAKVKIDYGWAGGKFWTGEFWSRDVEERPAISIPRAGDRAEEFRRRGETPIEQIPRAEMAVYLAGLKKLRKLEGVSDRDLMAKYRRVLQRAYAIQSIGASAEEVEAVLSGAME